APAVIYPLSLHDALPICHMGEIEIAGSDALATVQWLTSNDASKLSVGQVQYSALTTERGTFVDDLLVYRLRDDHFLLVVNAGNRSEEHTSELQSPDHLVC